MKPITARFVALALLVGAAPPVRSQEPPKSDEKAKTASEWLFLNQLTPDGTVLLDANGEYAHALGAYLAVRDPADELFGATFSPISDGLRAQLDIPAGQGLLVSNLRDGPASAAGLKQNDILLTLTDKPVAAAEDISKLLKAAGEKPAALKVLRGGKPVTLQVRPVYRVTLGAVAEEKKDFFIGVSINPVEEAIREQLALPAGGVIVSEVVKGSPAEAVGVKPHDILMQFGGKNIDTPENLAGLVQANQDKPTTIQLIRGGKPMSLAVTPAVRKAEAAVEDLRIRLWNVKDLTERQQRAVRFRETMTKKVEQGQPPATDPNAALQQQVTKLEAELKALRESMDKVNETLKAMTPKK